MKGGWQRTKKPGLVRLSASESVTNSTGLALPASENNAAVEGSIANRLRKNKEEIDIRPKIVVNREWIASSEESYVYSLEDSSTYLISVGNEYSVGSVCIFRTGIKRVGNSSIREIVTTERYFIVTAENYNSFKIVPNGASGHLTVIKVA